MEPLAKRLRERARELGLSDAEVGRRSGLSERRYGNYVRGSREPDLATLLRICSALAVTPDELLLPATPADKSGRYSVEARISAAVSALDHSLLAIALNQIEALAAFSRLDLRKEEKV